MPFDISSGPHRIHFLETRRERPPRAIIALRLLGILAAAGALLWLLRLTTTLSWQVDFLIAVAATLAWSYRFERDKS